MMRSNKNCMHKVLGLPGFLGKSTDWSIFDAITDPLPISGENRSFWPWASAFNAQVEPINEKKIIIGYSLGGRLAMHLLIDHPTQWAGAVLISAHPGLNSIRERKQRLESDKAWAERFLNDPWDQLVHDWNSNPIFGGKSFLTPRCENEFDRRSLSLQLQNWSLGNQENLLPKIQHLKMPILYVAGEEDTKFTEIAQVFAPFAETKIIPGASHRAPWDQPETFQTILHSFITRLKHE